MHGLDLRAHRDKFNTHQAFFWDFPGVISQPSQWQGRRLCSWVLGFEPCTEQLYLNCDSLCVRKIHTYHWRFRKWPGGTKWAAATAWNVCVAMLAPGEWREGTLSTESGMGEMYLPLPRRLSSGVPWDGKMAPRMERHRLFNPKRQRISPNETRAYLLLSDKRLECVVMRVNQYPSFLLHLLPVSPSRPPFICHGSENLNLVLRQNESS